MGGLLEDVGEQVAEMGKSAVKQVVKTPLDLAKAGAKQVKGNSDQAQGTPQNEQQQKAKEKAKTEEFVKDLYRPSEKVPAEGEARPWRQTKNEPEQTEEQKLSRLRQELHAKYYQNLINPPKQKEEKPAEKVEREKNEERWELQEKEKKKPQPLAAQRAAQRTEKFPGASG